MLFVFSLFYLIHAVLHSHQSIIRFFFVMFPAKLFADNLSQSDHRDRGHLCRDCVENIRKVFEDVDRQVFLYDQLTVDQRMFFLNNLSAIERRLVDSMADQIQTAIRSDYNLRRICIDNIGKQLRHSNPVNQDSDIGSRHGIHYIDDGDTGGNHGDYDEDIIDDE